MKEKVKRIIDKIIFFGHPPPKPIAWEEVRKQILIAIEQEGERRKKQMKAHGDICYKAGAKMVIDWLNDGGICEHKLARKRCSICWERLLKDLGNGK